MCVARIACWSLPACKNRKTNGKGTGRSCVNQRDRSSGARTDGTGDDQPPFDHGSRGLAIAIALDLNSHRARLSEMALSNRHKWKDLRAYVERLAKSFHICPLSGIDRSLRNQGHKWKAPPGGKHLPEIEASEETSLLSNRSVCSEIGGFEEQQGSRKSNVSPSSEI